MLMSSPLLRLLLILSALTASIRAAEPAPAASAADADWQKFEEVLSVDDGSPRPRTPEERTARIFRDIKRYVETGDAFIRQHPDDARRWKAFLQMKDFFGACLNMLKENPASTTAVNRVMAPGQRAQWTDRLAVLEKEFQAAPDVAPALRFQWDVAAWYETMASLREAKLSPDSPRWDSWRADLDALARKYPEVPDVAGLVKHYNGTRFPDNDDTPLRRRELASLAESGNPHLAEAARGQLRFLDLAKAPIEIAFTAADGRKVDLRDMRGKVVLIDFWATWCAPCIAELPNVKKVYAAYHDQGFEIVGITLENPAFAPKDTPEQKAAKLARAKDKMLAFVAENQMPWPQYFDGKWWKNDIAQRYVVQSIPAMFLLDKEGRLVSTDARGEKLEQEVKRLLKL